MAILALPPSPSRPFGSRHLSPVPGERMEPGWTPILSPGQGERWLAKQDGEGVLPPSQCTSPAFLSCKNARTAGSRSSPIARS